MKSFDSVILNRSGDICVFASQEANEAYIYKSGENAQWNLLQTITGVLPSTNSFGWSLAINDSGN